MDRAAHLLLPYVPRLVVDWLEEHPALGAQPVDATALFADISGFTTLTERLARRGKVGAEEMGDILNQVFGSLLESAYQYGAELVKWGGDAVLLLFRGEQHPLLAAAAAHRMQTVIERVGRVKTSGGVVRLGMSVGVHSGTPDCLLVGDVFRELVVTGPDAGQVALLESAAAAGQVVVSERTAALLTAAGGQVGPVIGQGRLLLEPAPVPTVAGAGPTVRTTDIELRRALPPPIAQHLVSAGAGVYEHRVATLCFLEFSGVDEMRAAYGLDRVAEAVDGVVSAAQRAAAAHEVTFLATDLYPDGGKVILAGGVPTSYGDDTTRVLAAVREVLDSDQVLPLRAGVNVGRVFAGDYGTAVRRVFSVTGDSVNLAARLMAKAGPGELVVSRDALDRTRTRYQVRELEPFLVKGKARPIEASVVTGPSARAPDDGAARGRLLPFVGRRKELDSLLDAYADARAGRGSLVDLRGETGIGKSRLVHEVLAQAGVDAQWLSGDLYTSGTPYAPFQRIVGAADLSRIVAEVAPGLRPMLPLIEVVAGVSTATKDDLQQLFGDARKELMEGAASELLGRMFDSPTVWVFDDVQFMDAASRDLLDRLARDVAARPWLIITTSRSDCTWRPPDDAPTTVLEIKPLGADDAEDLAASHSTGAAAPASRFASVIERAEGNPLFLTELLEAMRVGAVGSADDADELPDTVESAVAARIDQLAPSQRATLRAAAVLGDSVDLVLLATMSARLVGTDAGAPDLARLEEFLVPEQDGRWRFRHHLVRETAYEALPFRRRVVLHAAAADAIAALQPDDIVRTGLLSLHCLRGERYAEAFEHSWTAARHAAAHYANPEAVTLHRRALEAARRQRLPVRDLIPVLEGLAEAYLYVGDLDEMEATLRRARRSVDGDRLAVARLAALTTYQRRQTGRHSEAIRWTSRGRAVLDGRTDRAALRIKAELAFSRTQSLLSRGRFAEAERWALRCADEATAAGDRRRRASATQLRAVARHYAGESVDLAELVRNAAEQERLGDLKRAARSHNIIGVLAFDGGLWPMALHHYESAAELYRRLSQPLEVALQLANAAELLIFQLRLDEAEDRLAEAARLWRGAPMNGEQAFGITQRARCAMGRGEYAEARALFEESRQVHAANRETVQLLIVEGMLAECLLLSGDAGGALDLILDVEKRNVTAGADLRYLKRVRSLAEIATGRRDEGLRLLHEAVADAREIDHLYDEWRCVAALVRVAAGGSDLDPQVDDLAGLERAVQERLGVRIDLPAAR